MSEAGFVQNIAVDGAQLFITLQHEMWVRVGFATPFSSFVSGLSTPCRKGLYWMLEMLKTAFLALYKPIQIQQFSFHHTNSENTIISSK